MIQPHTRKEREVWQAINSLQADGLRIDDMTGEVISDRLLQLGYNRGSSTDVYRFKRSWVAAHISPQNYSSLSLSSQLSDPITLAASALKEKITQEAQIEVKRIQEEANKRCEQMLLELTSEQDKSNKFMFERDEYRDNLKCAEEEIKLLKSELEKNQQSLSETIKKSELLEG